ncbi:MAG: hypothetical protein LBU64_13910 [Planctomycetota bacterium]|jgi:ferredoxin-thioredoxin reductase catalytic subunit|nr:hypothetical protein [Planctomycetota bacterium]
MEDGEGAAGIRRRLERFLIGKSYGFNPDAELVDDILAAMAARRKKFGEEYCPCRRVTGDREADKAIICPCVHHQREIAERGHCHCRLFVGKKASRIPAEPVSDGPGEIAPRPPNPAPAGFCPAESGESA